MGTYNEDQLYEHTREIVEREARSWEKAAEAQQKEIDELKRQNELLKKHRKLENTKWEETDLDYRLGMCAAMCATIHDALKSFTDHDLNFVPHFSSVIPKIMDDMEKDKAWFDNSSALVSGCGTADRPSPNLLTRLADNRKRIYG